MRTSLLSAVTIALLLPAVVFGQSYYEYKFLFNGTAYRTDSSGNIVGTPINDQTLLRAQAQNLNVTNLSDISLVYHIDGGPPYGDTVDVISNATGQTLVTEFGFFFGSDVNLGRWSVTNEAQTEIRRVDQLYTFSNTTYTYENPDSLGGAFTCKRFLVDSAGNTNTFVDGTMSWDVTPTGTNSGSLLCIGDFSLGQPVH